MMSELTLIYGSFHGPGRFLSLLVMPMLITQSGLSQSLILIDLGVMLLIFAICPVVSSWCVVPLTYW